MQGSVFLFPMTTSRSNQKTTFVASPKICLNNQGETKDFDLTRDKHILGHNHPEVDLQVPSKDWSVISRCHALFRKHGQDYYIYDYYDREREKFSTNGLYVNGVRIPASKKYLPSEGLRLEDGLEIQIGQNPTNLISLTYKDPNASTTASQPTKSSVSLKNKSVVLGRDPSANLCLDAPTISRRHAVIDTDNRGRYVLHDHSTNGTFVNDQKVNSSAILTPGSNIRIGPYILVLQGNKLLLVDQGNHIRLDAKNLIREVPGENKQTIRLLNDISLPIEPGQFVALVGGSGAGKSTLMRTLLGIDPTTSGTVYLNGENLRDNFNIYRTQIGYVPQTDIVHRNLKVKDVLRYAAKLRLPPDADINSVIEKTLQEIELSERRDTLVKDLSGGQLKRVSIGVELLADPKLFFLDEPTSGLDPGLDKKMMQLLRKLANSGRTIILVTHATTNIEECDRIVFLGKYGNLCYFGPPSEATSFFNIPEKKDFAEIYIKLEKQEVAQKARETFLQSNYYQNYITAGLGYIEASLKDKQSSPSTTSSRKNLNPSNPNKSLPKQVKRSPLQQLSLLTQRYFNLTIGDRVNLALNLLTAPIGIALITLALGDKAPLVEGSEPDPTLAPLALRVLFVFTSAAIWVGLSSSLQEIIKEAAIYTRERLVNLGIAPYLGSKTVILGGLAFLQTILMTIVILVGFDSPSPDLLPWSWGVGITTFLTLFTSMSLGLMVSALVTNASQANSALPLLLIPQIIFSGVLFKMEGIGTFISRFMLSSWSVGAYGALVDVNSFVPEPTTLPDGSTVPQPFEVTAAYDPTWSNLGVNWGFLLLHTAVYLGLTYIIQKRKDIL